MNISPFLTTRTVFISAFLTLIIITASFGQRIGGDVGYSPQKWDYFDNGFRVDVFADIPVLSERVILTPQIGRVQLFYKKEYSDSITYNLETGFSGFSIISLGIQYKILKRKRIVLGIGPDFGLLFFGEHRDFFDNELLVPSEIRFTLGGNVKADWYITDRFGLNLKALSFYVPYSNLSVDKELYKTIRPFNEFIAIQFQLGCFYDLDLIKKH